MKPSERFRRRYILFVLTCGGAPPAHAQGKTIIHEHFLSFFGELGVSTLAFKLVKYDEKTGRGVVRCGREKVEQAIFCMACLADWKGEAARMEPVSTSGTISRL
ncbi:MAG: hypothetical protein N3F07_03295 [Candidatus Micrarchaeota archaeon]|nr:hypothetical protein [Candidatus Micrarchaeota archaeon]